MIVLAAKRVAVGSVPHAPRGQARATIRALILANEFLEAQISKGYMRGEAHARFKIPDWWD
ncbi:MAG TPA: hypothetical protein DEA80_17250 [Afipia sp.]|nr:hypothetical protein [Afipia sp.]HAP13302.1 hypothetical protein [Afipia sp.]HAP48698.1 hypothetical protein [Afipia sp.]HAQ92605.1 hypothetical protein [Afipia sp.]HBF52810.1 hypothetical protein [Afipia sp.]